MDCSKPALALLLAALCCTSITHGQDSSPSAWNGTWVAEGTLFAIAVTINAGRIQIRQIESLGFEWSSQDGTVDGDTVEVEVSYAGVTGIIQAQLVDTETAVVFARTCMPEFMVVCVLARDRQAVFRKTTP